MKKIFTLAAAVLASFSLAFAAETSNVGTYSTQVVSSDGLTSTWTFITPGSQVTVPTEETTDVGIIYAPSGSGKMKFSSSNGFSWLGASDGYIYVPAGSAGTITMTVKGSSDSRWLQLYVNGTAAADSKRLWSKYAATASDGKKGPQSFAFTADDLTTKGGKTYLHFKDNNTEMKIATFSITLTTGTYADCDAPTKPLVLSSDAAETVYVDDVITFTTGETGNGGEVSIEGAESETISENKWTAVAGTHTFTASQAKNGNYCAQESELKLTVLEKTPVTAVTVAGPTTAYKGNEVSYTATAANATAYRWKVDGAIQAGAEAAKFVYTANAKGTFSIVCEARNTFNAAEEWIPSEAKELTVSLLSGEIIAFTAETGSSSIDKDITATGIVGGTVHQKSAKDGKLNSENYYSLKLATGNFLAGDTVKITQKVSSKYVAPTLALSSKQDNSDIIGEATGITAPDDNPVTTVIVLTKNAEMIYLSRTGAYSSMNPIVASMSVVRPMAVKSTSEAFKSVSFNGEALVANFDANHAMTVEGSYVDAPAVVFTKTVTTIYEDDSQTSKDVEVNVTAEEVAGAWQAQATINSVTYTINAAKAASFTVHYMDGTTELGTENVATNGTVAEYAQYEKKSLATFVGWYTDVDLTIEAVLTAPITAETYLYAKFENKYAESVNIEKLILDNSKGYDVVANALNGTNGYASNYNSEGMDISNDSLNDGKGAMRNYAYLGLKIKSKSLLNFRVAQGQTVRIKFGNVATTPQVSINGGEYAAMTITEGVYSYTATGDDLLSMYVSEANKAVVLKQIMIGEAPALEDVVYDINCAETTNGTLSCNWAIALPGETVALTVTPAEGYKIAAVTVNGETVEAVEGAYSFIMPAAAAAVSATFVEDTASALGNTEVEAKAVKVVRDGQLLILKNGVLYNAQGAIVK